MKGESRPCLDRRRRWHDALPRSGLATADAVERDGGPGRSGLPDIPLPGEPAPNSKRVRDRVTIGVYGGHGRDRRRRASAQMFTAEVRREAMGISWMTGAELSQAIPPAYTEFIGSLLRNFLASREAGA